MTSRFVAAVSACVFIFGLVTTAYSGQITQLVIQDVGSTVGGAYSDAPDGNSGGFAFGPVDPETYAGLIGFSTDTGVPMLWGTLAAPFFQGPVLLPADSCLPGRRWSPSPLARSITARRALPLSRTGP